MNKPTGWLTLDFYEFIILDRVDGQRIRLKDGEELLVSVDSFTVRTKENDLYIYPAIQILQAVCKRRQDEN